MRNALVTMMLVLVLGAAGAWGQEADTPYCQGIGLDSAHVVGTVMEVGPGDARGYRFVVRVWTTPERWHDVICLAKGKLAATLNRRLPCGVLAIVEGHHGLYLEYNWAAGRLYKQQVVIAETCRWKSVIVAGPER